MYFPPLCSYYYHQPTTTTTGSGMKECDVVDPTGFGYYKGNKEVYVPLSLSLSLSLSCIVNTALRPLLLLLLALVPINIHNRLGIA